MNAICVTGILRVVGFKDMSTISYLKVINGEVLPLEPSSAVTLSLNIGSWGMQVGCDHIVSFLSTPAPDKDHYRSKSVCHPVRFLKEAQICVPLSWCLIMRHDWSPWWVGVTTLGTQTGELLLEQPLDLEDLELRLEDTGWCWDIGRRSPRRRRTTNDRRRCRHSRR